jgi:hypothetical protein
MIVCELAFPENEPEMLGTFTSFIEGEKPRPRPCKCQASITEPGLSIKKALSIWQWRIKRFHKLEVVLLGNHDPCLAHNRAERGARGSESSGVLRQVYKSRGRKESELRCEASGPNTRT